MCLFFVRYIPLPLYYYVLTLFDQINESESESESEIRALAV